MGNGTLSKSLKKLRAVNTGINLRDVNRIIRRTEGLIAKIEKSKQKSISEDEKKLCTQELGKLHIILKRFKRFRAEIEKGGK